MNEIFSEATLKIAALILDRKGEWSVFNNAYRMWEQANNTPWIVHELLPPKPVPSDYQN